MLCPLCQNETKSKNKGHIRHRTCRACAHEFTTIEVIKEPEMTAKERLERFMRDRKKSVDTATLAAYFILHASTINENMRELESEGKVTRFKNKAGKNIWSWNYKLAFSPKPTPVQSKPEPAPRIGPPTKAAPSFPHIRGYDD